MALHRPLASATAVTLDPPAVTVTVAPGAAVPLTLSVPLPETNPPDGVSIVGGGGAAGSSASKASGSDQPLVPVLPVWRAARVREPLARVSGRVNVPPGKAPPPAAAPAPTEKVSTSVVAVQPARHDRPLPRSRRSHLRLPLVPRCSRSRSRHSRRRSAEPPRGRGPPERSRWRSSRGRCRRCWWRAQRRAARRRRRRSAPRRDPGPRSGTRHPRSRRRSTPRPAPGAGPDVSANSRSCGMTSRSVPGDAHMSRSLAPWTIWSAPCRCSRGAGTRREWPPLRRPATSLESASSGCSRSGRRSPPLATQPASQVTPQQ